MACSSEQAAAASTSLSQLLSGLEIQATRLGCSFPVVMDLVVE
jgi:hypothetical protein